MLLSKTCIYALRASVYLASRRNREFVTIREMSDELQISFHFLTKVLQQLTRAGILESYKGPNGGVRLNRAASTICFLDVVVAIDGEYLIKECALGLPGCGEMKPCALHDQWSVLKEKLLFMMKNITLDELAKRNHLKDQPSAEIKNKKSEIFFFEPK